MAAFVPGSTLSMDQERGPVALAPYGARPRSSQPLPVARLVFVGVTVVDVRTGRLLPNHTIVVEGTRIQAVGPAEKVVLPDSAQVVKAHGAYVIPGLWDMHVHPRGFMRTSYALFLANGVTGVRDMHTPFLDSVLVWRREIAAGRRVGPRILVPGPWLSAPADLFWNEKLRRWSGGAPSVLGVATRADAFRLVDSLKRAGADFIKVRDNLPRETYFAIAAAARQAGLPLVGHSPEAVTLEEASDSGQRSFEHGIACNRAALGAAPEVRTAFKAAECEALARQFLRNKAWVSIANPSLGTCAFLAVCAEEFRYWPDSVFGSTVDRRTRLSRQKAALRSLEAWSVGPAGRSPIALGPQFQPTRKVPWADLQRAGIRLLAGTDAAQETMILFGTVSGFSLHHGLWHLVQQGLTPLEALRTATINPAEYLGAADSLGTIAPGNVADLVFLDADPLTDIYNTRRIRAVVANGRFFDRGDLDALLAETERAAGSAERRQP